MKKKVIYLGFLLQTIFVYSVTPPRVIPGHRGYVLQPDVQYPIYQAELEWRHGHGSSIFSMESGDVDNDGTIEVIFCNYQGFIEIMEYSHGVYVDKWRSKNLGNDLRLSIGDIDKDGVNEIVVGNNKGEIYIFNYKGEIVYQEWFGEVLVGPTNRIKIDDPDNDGDVEIIIYERNKGYIYLYDRGKLQKEASMTVSNEIYGLDIGDVDNDGLKEVVLGTENSIKIYKYNGYRYEEEGKYDHNYLRSVVEIGDTDNDGFNEIVFGTAWDWLTGGGQLQILGYNYGEYQIEWSSEYCVSETFIAIVVEDIDYDSYNEIIVSNIFYSTPIPGHRLSILGYNGDNYSTEWTSVLYGCPPTAIVADNLTGDSVNETFFATNKFLASVKYNGEEYFEQWRSDDYGDAHRLSVGDVNGDGKDEIVIGSWVYNCFNTVQVINYQNGSYEKLWQDDDWYICNNDLAVGDLTGDNIDEFVSAGLGHPSLRVFTYKNGEFIKDWESDELGGYIAQVAIGNTDNSPLNELVVSHAKGVYIYQYDNGTYVEKYRLEDCCGGLGGLTIEDVDDDEYLEIVSLTDRIYVIDYYKQGPYEFYHITWESEPFDDISLRSLSIGDVDKDGRGEIVIGTWPYSSSKSAHVYIYGFNGESFDLEWSSKPYGKTHSLMDGKINSILVVDLDKNGVDEIIAAEYNRLHVIEHTNFGYKEKWTKVKLGGTNVTDGNTDNDTESEIVLLNGGYLYTLQVDSDGWQPETVRAGAQGDLSGKQFHKTNCLYQNRPNPVRDLTEIMFQLKNYDLVRITIYDVLGQEVKVLENAVKQPGYYSVIWDGKDSRGRNLPNGIYFIKMKVDDFESTKKILLIK